MMMSHASATTTWGSESSCGLKINLGEQIPDTHERGPADEHAEAEEPAAQHGSPQLARRQLRDGVGRY